MGPEKLLLAVLIRAKGQRVLRHDAQALQALLGFGGNHGRAVVLEQGARQAALFKGLAQPVAEFLGAFAQIPLSMAAKPGVVVQHAQQQRISPLAALQEDAQRPVMEVQVPEAVDIGVFVAAHLAALEAMLGGLGAGAIDRAAAPALEQALGLHEAQHRGIGRGRTQFGLLLRQHGQVVGVKLVAPIGVLPVLENQGFPEWQTQAGVLAQVGAELALQRGHRVLLFIQRQVIPALDGGRPELDPLRSNGVAPFLGGQLSEALLEFAA